MCTTRELLLAPFVETKSLLLLIVHLGQGLLMLRTNRPTDEIQYLPMSGVVRIGIHWKRDAASWPSSRQRKFEIGCEENFEWLSFLIISSPYNRDEDGERIDGEVTHHFFQEVLSFKTPSFCCCYNLQVY